MTDPTILDAVLRHHVAVLGKTGSGKTSTVKYAIERAVSQGARVCVLDSIKSDHWGLISNVDGTAPGLPFTILGGPHGHVPLTSSAGAAVGKLVGQGKLPLSIIDMAKFEAGGLQRFFVDFADALMDSMRGVLYLVIEEAHEFAPKERAGIGAESLAIHWAKKLATAGRSKGIRLVVATQRVQALHNAVLGSCETLIAHRLTAPADQKPIVDWLKANADKPTVATVSSTLSSLPTGTGWVCAGEAAIFARVEFPKFSTYDNARTPTAEDPGDHPADLVTKPVDQAELQKLLGSALAEAEANDPAMLKAEIARLKAVGGAPSQEALDEAARAGMEAGEKRGRQTMALVFAQRLMALAKHIASSEEWGGQSAPAEPEAAPAAQAIPAERQPAAETSAAPAPVNKAPAAPTGGDASLSGPQRNLLAAMAWWRALGHITVTRTQLAARAGVAPKGSTLRARLSELHAGGFVEYPRTGVVQLTPKGVDAAPQPDMSMSLIDAIKAVLSGPQLSLFVALDAHRYPMTRAALAELVGWEPGGSTLRARLSELHQMELVEYPSKGVVKLQDWVTT